MRKLGRVIAEKLNVDYIEIHGAVRTTGANPGRRSGVVGLSRPTEPQLSSGANTPEAARILVKRQLPLRTAHAILTEMVDYGKAFVTVPCVDDYWH